jgi:pimeloyl-ACP methyl ester carboxylesterase
MADRIRYAPNGDINIAYAVLGSGPPDMVWVQGAATNIGVLLDDPEYRGFCERIATFSRFVLFDKRGMGLSERVEAGTMEDRMDDVRAILDAIGSRRAVVVGVSEGGLMAELFAATHPDRTEALILIGAEVREENDGDWRWGDGTRAEFDASMADWSHWGEGRNFPKLVPSLANDLRARAWWGRVQLQAGNPRTIEAHYRVAFASDMRPVLPTIRVPTLIIHRTDDRAVSVEQGRYLAAHIPGARYVELPGADHLPWVNGDDILAEMEEFVTGSRPATEADRVLATVLFSDIVDSTRLAAELGDRRWRRLLEAHHAMRSTRLVTASWRASTAPHGPFGALSTCGAPSPGSTCASASGCTPGRWSGSTASWAGSRCTSAPGWPHWLAPVRSSSRARSATWSPARASALRTGEPTS